VVTRENGKHDRYCGSVFKTTDTPCNHIIVDGKPFNIQAKDFWTSPSKAIVVSAAIVLMDAVFSQETG